MFKSAVVLLGCVLVLASAMPSADTDLQKKAGKCNIAKIIEDVVADLALVVDKVVSTIDDASSIIGEMKGCTKEKNLIKEIECFVDCLTEGTTVQGVIKDLEDLVDNIQESWSDISAEIKACKKKDLLDLLDFVGEEEF